MSALPSSAAPVAVPNFPFAVTKFQDNIPWNGGWVRILAAGFVAPVTVSPAITHGLRRVPNAVLILDNGASFPGQLCVVTRTAAQITISLDEAIDALGMTIFIF